MKLKLKVKRGHVIAGMVILLVGMIFLAFWLFADRTQIFNDYIEKDSYGSDYCYGWIHMAVNCLLGLSFIGWLIIFIWELDSSNSTHPFAFLYDRDNYNYRRSRRNENDEEEEKPEKPIRWKRWILLAVLAIFLITLFKFGKTIYKQSVFMYNTSKKYQNTYQQKVEEKLGFYDKLWKTYQTKAQITNMNKDIFIEVTKIIMANVADGENLSWKWVSRYPDIDYNQFTAFYADLSSYIEKQRDGYFSIEKTCQLIANQNNTLLDTFPNNLYNKVLKIERINFQYGFLSDSTNNVFARRIENLK
jgi:hypothetical protein